MKVRITVALLVGILAGREVRAQGTLGDTLLPKAIAFLEKNLNDLRQVGTRAQEFTNAFTDESSRVACDICEQRDQPLATERYAFLVEDAYPDGFAFVHRIDQKHITMRKLDRAEYEWRIPLTKTIPVSGKSSATYLSKSFTVHHMVLVRYLDGRFSIRSIEAEKAREAQLFVDISGVMGMGDPTFADQKDFAPEVAANNLGIGVSWYFNPFSRTNKANIWLKTGLRASMRTDKLTAEGLRYEQVGIIHTSALGAHDQPVDLAPTIDVGQHIYDLTETTRSTLLTIPLSISKRAAMGSKLEFALEAEVNFSYAVLRNTSGHYTMDQTGTNQRINSELMDATGGTILTYTSPAAAVVDAATGERIDFYTDRTEALDDLDAGQRGSLGFALQPALIIHKNGEPRYLVGVRAQWDGMARNSGVVLDHRWFTHPDDKERPSLGSLTSSRYRLFVGITMGIRL